MRLSELIGKEIINYLDGARLGVIGESDVVINPDTGEIDSVIMPRRGSRLAFWLEQQQLVIPWEAIRKIGTEIVIVEINPDSNYQNDGYW